LPSCRRHVIAAMITIYYYAWRCHYGVYFQPITPRERCHDADYCAACLLSATLNITPRAATPCRFSMLFSRWLPLPYAAD
jgi:hypothetical protein